jgi:predicted flap endonuclease-1-like 5' DNA nuclease
VASAQQDQSEMKERTMSGRSSRLDGDDDDFTRIFGIGRALNSRLHQAGVTSYADLAALNPEKIVSLLADAVAVSAGRIGNEGWISQASKLAEEAAAPQVVKSAAEAVLPQAGKAAAEAAAPAGQGASGDSSDAPPAASATGLHYESFVVRILLHDVDGRVANTTIQHVGSGTEHRWPGLDEPALLNFISAYVSHGAIRPLPVPQVGGPGEDGLPGPELPSIPPSTLVDAPLTLERDPRVPRSGEPFTVVITLDLTHLEPQLEPRARFLAMVLARPLSGAAAQVVSEADGILCADAPQIMLRSAGLPTGTYRLEAVVHLIGPHGGSRDLVASVEGSILVVSGR